MSSKKSAKPLNKVRIRSIFLSDVLKAELSGDPLNWNRYRVSKLKWTDIIDECHSAQLVEIKNSNCLLKFNGLVLLRTPEAKSLLVDCRKVLDVIGQQYREHLDAFIPLIDVASRARISVKRTLLAVSFFNRDSFASINHMPQPLSEESQLGGYERIIRGGTFSQKISELRASLTKSHSYDLEPRNYLPGFGPNRVVFEFSDEIERLGSDAVRADWKNCQARIGADPAGAITAAKAMAESACKQILVGRGLEIPSGTNMTRLYANVMKEIGPSKSDLGGDALGLVLKGCATVVTGLSQLRNELGDSHGKLPGATLPSVRQAKLAVALSGAIVGFILSADDGRKFP